MSFCYDSTGGKCSGKAQPGAIALRNAVRRLYPGIGDLGIYNCRPTRGGGSLSTHGEGRGWDAKCDANTQKELGDRLAEDLIEHCAMEELGIQRVIWNRRQWDSRTRAWRAYSGVSPHTDHLHIELCWESAKKLTEERVTEVLGQEEPMTDEEFDKHMKRFISTVGIDFGWPIGAPDQEQTRTLAHVVKSLLRQNELMGQALGRIEKKLSP